MENSKMNDMLLSTMSNPQAKTLDFLSNGVTPDNTQLLKREDYKSNDNIKAQFTDSSGVFNDEVFDQAYGMALNNLNKISNESAFNNLDDVEYESYDWTRPIASKVRAVDIKFSKDYNPHLTAYNRDHFGSVTESELSLREIAQRGRIHDIETDTWSEQSPNDLGIFDKFFGDTLVYAQWDEDGVHQDPVNGNMVNHSVGDWKSDEYGKLYVEKLGKREIYGRQVINPTDILTTDGSLANKLDFLDSDGREKSIGAVAVKTIVEIAPLLIPGFNTIYGGTRAAVGLATVMPTFLKSLEGMLLGDSKNYGDDPISKAEGWMAKYRQPSTSDAGSESMWNIEQMAQMVTGIFSQIYEQRAMAGLSKYMVRPNKLLDSKTAQLQSLLTNKAAAVGQIAGIDTSNAIQNAVRHLPELQKAFANQSTLAKSLSLGYMALSSTSEVYGEALAGGFDRRSAGFASLLAAGGQYAIMMNNRMGHWFLDKTTGYTEETNKALMKKSVQPWLASINKIFEDTSLTQEQQKAALAGIVKKFSIGANSFFKGPSVLGEAMLKNSFIEGIEEVTEEVVEDMSKGVLDIMSYLGLTKKKGSFGTVERFQTGEWFDDYLSNFVGGVLGGGLFELEASRIDPWMRKTFKGEAIPKQTVHSIYELVANGHKQDLINMIRRESPKLTNKYLSYRQDINTETSSQSDIEADFAANEGASQSDLVTKSAIEMIEHLEGILGSEGLILTDEEIINKAIGNELKIHALEKMKGTDELGVERILLDKFKKNAYEAADLRSIINDYEASMQATDTTDKDSLAPKKNRVPSKESSDIELKREQYKEKMKEVKSILNGERNMDYFHMMTIAMNPDIQKIFGSLDRYSYITAKYNLDYNTLEDTGTDGLTKEFANEDWNMFVNSTDMLGKLEAITKGYLKLENYLNDPIASTIESGYYDIRKVTNEDFMNLQTSVTSFNVAKTSEEREAALNNFIAINKYLEGKGAIKVLPWDSYKTELGDKIFNEGLIKKITVDENGVEQIVDYTEAELNEVLGNKKTRKETIVESINNVMETLPSNPLSMDLITTHYNAIVKHNNANLDKQIDDVQNSDISAEDKAKETSFYQGSKFNSHMAPLTDSNSRKAFDAAHLRQHEANQQVYIKNHEEAIDTYKEVQHLKSVYTIGDKLIDFKSLVNKNGGTNGDWATLSVTGKFKLLDTLNEIGVFNEFVNTMDNVIGFKDSAIEYVNALDNRDSTKKIDTVFEADFYKWLEPNIKYVTDILSNTDISDRVNELKKLEEAYVKEAENNMPNMFTMHNYAFDFLVDALKKGHLDNEMFLEAKKMYDEELKSLAKLTFPEANHISLDSMNKVLQLSDSNSISVIMSQLIDSLDLNLNADEDGEGNRLSDLLDSWDQDVEDGYILLNEDNLLLKDILTDNFNNNAFLQDIVSSLGYFKSNLQANKSTIDSLSEFIKIDASNMVKSPIYDALRNFHMQMDSNPNSKVNTIFKISEREEFAYKSSAGADQFTSQNLNGKDIQQAINTIDMFKSVVNAMSTTERYGDDFNGFLAMRKDFASKYGIKDSVSDLKTINSDQAALMSLDLQRLKTRLEFIKALAEHNQKNKAAENTETGIQAMKAHIGLFRDLEGVQDLTPTSFKDILNSDRSDFEMISALETEFYDHNKGDKVGAMEKILKYHLKNVSISELGKYTRETTSMTITPYAKAVYFATNLSLRTSDYLLKQKKSLEGAFNKVPFFLQDYAVKMSIATIQNQDIFSKIFEIKQDKTNDLADFITFVLGGTGTGKTTAIGAQLLDIMRQTNPNSNIWLGGPTMEQAHKLHSDTVEAIGDADLNLTSVDIDKIFSLIGVEEAHDQIKKELRDIDNKDNKIVVLNKDTKRIEFVIDPTWETKINYKNLPNLLLFDEVTHLSKAELLLLNFVSKASYNNNSGNFFKVIGTGDTSQLGYQALFQGQYIEYNVSSLNAIYTPYLSASLRSNNNHKKLNSEMLLHLVEVVRDIFSKENKKKAPNYKEADNKFYDFVTSVNNETGLSYSIKGSTFRGDYITDSYGDLKALVSIKKDIDAKVLSGETVPELRALTMHGTLNPEILAAMTKAGMDEDFLEKHLKVHTLANVQGSETDYFIYDMAELPNYDKKRDLMRAFYTYTMRSRNASIIYDIKDTLKTELNITNAAMSEGSVDFNILSTDVINEFKTARIEEINNLKGYAESSDDSNYKWRSGKIVAEQRKGDTGGDGDGDVKGKLPTESISIPTSTKTFEGTSEKTIKKVPLDQFKALGYSFLHIPNAKVTVDKNGIPVRLERNASPFSSDLNGRTVITDRQQLTKVINQWSKLKNILLRSPGDSIKINEFPDFFKHVFGDGITDNVSVEYITLATLFNKKVHTPILTHTGSKGALSEGDLLRTVNAKLTLGTGENAKFHYITLASFPSAYALEHHGLGHLLETEGVTGEKSKILSDYTTNNEKLVKQLSDKVAKNEVPLLITGKLDAGDLELNTSTLLWDSGKVKHSLESLKYKFPGMEVSEIRVFPNDATEFNRLVNRYTFGTQRTAEQLITLRTGVNPEGSMIHEPFSGKPYVVVSYANDLNGNSGDTTSAKLIPIVAEARDMETLQKEIYAINKEISNIYKTTARGENVEISPAINAKQEALLDRNQILDILIEWGNTVEGEGTLLDLLTTEVDTGLGMKTMLDIFSKFRSEKGGSINQTAANFLEVLKAVKNHTGENYSDPKAPEGEKTSKQLILEEISGLVGWSWEFKNIFTYETTIKNQVKYKGDRSNLDVNSFINLTNLAEIFENSLKDKKFYYSIPIKPGVRGDIVVNNHINGSNGYSSDFYADKFFITTTPQSERVLFPIEFLTNLYHDGRKSVTDKDKKKKKKGGPTGGGTKLSFGEAFFNHFSDLESLLDAAEVYNPGILAALETSLANYTGDIENDKIGESLKKVIKQANIPVVTDGSDFTLYDLDTWLTGDIMAYPEGAEGDALLDKIKKSTEDLYNQMVEACK